MTSGPAIRKLVDTWFAATKSCGITPVLNLMTGDAVFMVPGARPFGKAAFAAASKGMKDIRFRGTIDIRAIR